nr:equilibrative nucleotide transporter 3-like isoform X2 [Populus alba]XP_034906411.1 equilibrative nucleotide transporter 3-like isoform X2 [Populus alba]
MACCWALGLATLVAWNCMLTIEDYYYKLFPKYHPARMLTLIYMPFAVVSMAILTYYESKIDTRKRNLSGLVLFFLSSLLLLLLDLASSGKGGIGNFIGIGAIAGSFGVADALLQGGMVGDLFFMCPEFLQSYLAGIAASGFLISALRLLTKAAFEKFPNGLRKGVILFLVISTFFEFLCILVYAYLFPKLPIVKYYRLKASTEGSNTVSADLAAGGIHINQGDENEAKRHERLSNKELFFENIDYAVDLTLIFVLTLSIVPGFIYEDTGSHQLHSWYAIVLITVFNACDMISRYIPLVEFLKLKSRKGLMIAALSRFLLIPAFYFTAKYGDQGWMILLISFLGLTNGYLTVCVVTEAPQGYKGPEQNALGNLLVLCVLCGVFAGVALDWLWLVGKKEF